MFLLICFEEFTYGEQAREEIKITIKAGEIFSIIVKILNLIINNMESPANKFEYYVSQYPHLSLFVR